MRSDVQPCYANLPNDVQVLILAPLRSMALQIVTRLLKLTQRETRADSVQNKARFLEEFGEPEDDVDVDGNQRNQRKEKKVPRFQPPAEHIALFAGNSDDHFCLGMKITRCTTLSCVDCFVVSSLTLIVWAGPLCLAVGTIRPHLGQSAYCSSVLDNSRGRKDKQCFHHCFQCQVTSV